MKKIITIFFNFYDKKKKISFQKETKELPILPIGTPFSLGKIEDFPGLQSTQLLEGKILDYKWTENTQVEVIIQGNSTVFQKEIDSLIKALDGKYSYTIS